MPFRSASPVAILLGLLFVPSAAALDPADHSPSRVGVSRGHAELSRERPRKGPARLRAAHRTPSSMEAGGPVVEREVMGYLPYWEIPYEVPRWDLLTTLAWFGIDLNTSGEVIHWHAWQDRGDLVDEAHAHGVRVVVTVTLFGNEKIGTLLASATARQTAIESCLAAMAVHSADGVNIDFETVPLEVRDEFTSFMTELKAAVAYTKPNGHTGHVTLAGPAVDWSGSYDYDQLLLHTDGIMVMAYDYHWTGGDPGPVAPLSSGEIWSKWNVVWTIDDYLEWGKVENRKKIFLGLPLYGRRWPVSTATVPTTSLGDGEAVLCSEARETANEIGYSWDDHSQTPYYHQQEQQLWQVWFDDQASFGMKVAAAVEADLGGIGLWALGYDGEDMAEWLEIEDQLTGLNGPSIDEDASSEPDGAISVEPDTGDEEPEVGPTEDVPSSGPHVVTHTTASSHQEVSRGCGTSGDSPLPWGAAVAFLFLGLSGRTRR